MASNALSSASVTSNIKQCSNKHLLRFFRTLRREDVEELLFLFVEKQEKDINDRINASGSAWMPEVEKRMPLFLHLRSYFDTSGRAAPSTQTSPLVTLPASIGGYIISFTTMHDRLRYKRICRDFYKFCEMPIAKYHFVIGHDLIRAIKYNQVRPEQFSHARYLEVHYVFDTTIRTEELYQDLDERQYFFIHRALMKGSSVHTLQFQLKYNHYSTHLVKHSKWTKQGHLLEWMNEVDPFLFESFFKKSERRGLFKSVRKLIWTPSANWRGGSHVQANHKLFFDLLPNLTSIEIDRLKLYAADFNHFGISSRDSHDDDDVELSVLKYPFYRDQLEHFQMNLNVALKRISGVDDVRHIDIPNHPLSHIFKFSNLRSLTLTLPIFAECYHYYSQLWSEEVMDGMRNQKCMLLTDLSLHFVQCPVTNIRTPQNANMQIEPLIEELVISRICKYIFSFCPNVTHYSLRTNAYSERVYAGDHLMGYYDRLEYLQTDTVSILPENVRMLSLRSLTIRISECVRIETDEVVKERLSELDLSSYPKLESFKFILPNKLKVKFQNLNKNVLSFLKFVSESQSKGSAVNLKYIGMYHNTLYKNGKIKPQKSNCFEKVKNDGKSLKICKAVISLTEAGNEGNIKRVELNPVRMASKDIDYLRFWFNGEFGKIHVEEYGNNVIDVAVLGALE